MKAYIIDSVLEQLKNTKQVELYGIVTNQETIISSLKKKLGLKRIGIYQNNKSKLPINLENDKFAFYLHKDQLYCIYNPGNKMPYKSIVVEEIKYTTDFHNRNHGIIDESILQEKIVTIIGLGSGGSTIADDLTRAGVTNFILIDFDTVSVNNICRSIFDLNQIGKKKTEAVLEKILRINPCTKVRHYNEDALEMDFEKVKKIIDSSDLVIEATDSVKSKIFVNGIAYQSKPVLYPSVYDLGKGGDILFTLPGLPCYECVFHSIMDTIKKSKKGEWDYSQGKAKPMPALISDIKIVVARTVKLALAILVAGTKNCFIEKITEPGCNLLLIGNETGVSIFDHPFQEIWAETIIDSECSCRTLS